jgi:hypothetical protein
LGTSRWYSISSAYACALFFFSACWPFSFLSVYCLRTPNALQSLLALDRSRVFLLGSPFDASPYKVTSRATHCIVWTWAYDEDSLLGVCSTTLALARLPARSCSAVKACPQVLHLHFAFGLIRLPVPNPLFSLGRNAMTNSPPHSRHCRLAMVTLFPRRLGLFGVSKLESPVQDALPKFGRKRVLVSEQEFPISRPTASVSLRVQRFV